MTAWSPLRLPLFRAIWIATLVSNIGTWMQNTAAAWLMTSLAPSAFMVALVQTATTLPVFLLALPAGALADVVDRRRLLLLTQSWMLLAATILGALTIAGLTTPWVLLGLTLSLGLGSALNAPAWQAIIPELVPLHEVPTAVALNSAGFNLARVVGPAIGGIVVGTMGSGAAFLLNAASFLCVLAVLFGWRRSGRESTLPAERMIGAIKTGARFVLHAPLLQAIFVRTLAFIFCASAIMALLPLLARQGLKVDSVGYGLLLGSFGAGAVAGALALAPLRERASLDGVVAMSQMLFAAVLALLAVVSRFGAVCIVLFVGGAAWLSLLSSLTGSVQSVVPTWVRGRAISFHMLIVFGGMAAGSTVWGTIAGAYGIPRALIYAAGGLVAGLALTARLRLSSVGALDLTPSMHWPSPPLPNAPRHDEGPVLVTVEYIIDPARAEEFARAMRSLRNARMRGGAMRWGLYSDTAKPGRYVESFMVESWIEHLRQHERVTVADREIEATILSFHKSERPPRVSHLVARSLPK